MSDTTSTQASEETPKEYVSEWEEEDMFQRLVNQLCHHSSQNTQTKPRMK